jgi:hypothetical protein
MRRYWYRFWNWWRELSGVHRATFLLEIVGIVVVAIYTTVAALQWYQMKAATKATKRAADAAKKSADAATKANNLAQIGLMANVAFAMSVTNWPGKPNPPGMTVCLNIRNTGRTDAFDFQIDTFHQLTTGALGAHDDPFPLYAALRQQDWKEVTRLGT